jgi:hypothetical protein
MSAIFRSNKMLFGLFPPKRPIPLKGIYGDRYFWMGFIISQAFFTYGPIIDYQTVSFVIVGSNNRVAFFGMVSVEIDQFKV